MSRDERWCFWPVGNLQGIAAIACGRWASNSRWHPDGVEVCMCDEHTIEFDRLAGRRSA
jgi:hypothetical protein